MLARGCLQLHQPAKAGHRFQALGVRNRSENSILKPEKKRESFHAIDFSYKRLSNVERHADFEAVEVIRAAYHLESPLPHGPRVVGVEGLEELLQKIGREEQES